MRVIPPYVKRHTGTALICGPAPSLFDDFARIRPLLPDATLFALSWAVRAVRAEQLVSLEFDRCAEYRALAAHDHPGHAVTVHSQFPMPFRGFGGYPAIDYFWEAANDAHNTAIGACIIAFEMGFERVVLAGVTLDGTPGYAVQIPRVCGWAGEQGRLMAEYAMEGFARRRAEWQGRLFAMSGAPRAMFGLPAEAA